MTKDDLELHLYRWRYGPDSDLNAYELAESLWNLFYPSDRPESDAAIMTYINSHFDDEEALVYTWQCWHCDYFFESFTLSNVKNARSDHLKQCKN